MKKWIENHKVILIFMFFGMIWTGICSSCVGKLYGPTMVPDEVGYWAHAAYILGYDWKEVMSLEPYYSFGYSLLMIPCMIFTKNPTILYRAMVLINFLLLFAGMLILYQFAKKALSNIERKIIAYICGVVMVYSAYIVYAQMTMVEILLTFLFILVVFCLYRFLINPTGVNMTIAVLCMAYMYTVHMRTIGIVIAGVATLIIPLVMKKDKQKYLLLFTGVVILLVLMIFGYQSGYVEQLDGVREAGRNLSNDYSGQTQKLRYILTGEGILKFGASFLGKLYYLGSATFGIFYWGAYSIGKRAVKSINRLIKQKEITTDFIYVFLFVGALLTIVISAIFMINTQRLDGVIYGRYNEMILPVFLLFGILEMLQSVYLKRGLKMFIGFQSICYFAVNAVATENDVASIAMHSVTGVAYALKFTNNHMFNITFLVFLGGCILGTIFIGMIMMVKKNKEWYKILGLIMGVHMIISSFTCIPMNYEINERNYSNIQVAEDIRELGIEGRKVKYLYCKYWGRLDLLQYCLQEVPIHVIQSEEPYVSELMEDDIVVTGRTTIFNDILAAKYTDYMESNHYSVYYNSYDGE